MPDLTFDKNDPRVVRSRTQKKLSNNAMKALLIMGILGAILVAITIVIRIKMGWFLASAVTTMFIVYFWYKGDVETIEPLKKDTTPESIIESDLLARVKSTNFTAADAIVACLKTDAAAFFNIRFGITQESLIMASQRVNQDWWETSKRLWNNMYIEDGVSAAHIIAGVIVSSSAKNDILISASTTEQDLLNGVAWYIYKKRMFNTVRSRTSKGGIARDWAVGYTPMLNRFAYDISHDIQYGGSYHRDIFGHQQIVSRIEDSLANAGRSNIILVGNTGVGKTTCVEAFASHLLFEVSEKSPLRFYKVYDVNTSAMLSQMNSQNLLDNAITSMAVEALKAKNIILYFPDISNLFGIEGGIDSTNTLLPILQNGNIRVIFSTTEGQWKWLQQNKPHLASLMNFQAVPEPSEDDVMRILENKSITMEYKYKCVFTYNSLKNVYRLSKRYGPEIAMPAKAINVMETVARINSGALITQESVASAIEQTTGVKTGSTSGSEKDKLLSLSATLHKKVIGQEEAVATVVSALQRSRAGVSNQDKPIGTFLFLGPTGVGKTETAKAVAEAYFGGKDKLIRVDMNEYVTQEGVARLLESGSTQSNTLLDSIRKQPFSVVLLDEIEKAHPDVVNSLLQMLDEGVMRDAANKAVSFKDSIIIATSNAGAENIASYEQKVASSPDSAVREFTQQLIQSGLFKPEFINRFDNIVVYRPLSAQQLEQVVDIQILAINDNLSVQQLSVKLTPAARTWLAEKGHDPLMGARPLRRLIQQTVENIISRRILENRIVSGSGQSVLLDVSDLENA